MIYPENIGLKDMRELRLRTLESIWIQGKLKIWGQWSYVRQGGGSSGVMSQFCPGTKVTKSAVAQLLRTLKKNGCNKADLASYLKEVMDERNGSFTGCTDKEGLQLDGVIGRVLSDNPGLLSIIKARYIHNKSMRSMAAGLHARHPDWCFRTCESRVSQWLAVAEYFLYRPMSEEFGRNPERFYG